MFTIPITKADTNLTVDWDSLPEVSKQFIIAYGLKQKLNDAGSSATVKELGKEEAAAQSLSVAESILENLQKGIVNMRSVSTKADRFITNAARELFKKAVGGKLDEMPDSSNKFLINAIAEKLGKDVELIQAAVEKRAEQLKVQAEAIAAIKAQAPSVDIEL